MPLSESLSRRALFGAAIAAAALPAAALPAVAGTGAAHSPVRLVRCWIAGTAYHQWFNCRDAIELDAALILRRQPGNAYDPRAIEVFAHGRDGAPIKLGYVPRARNEAIAALMDAGFPLTARLDGLGSCGVEPRMTIEMLA
jgi:hypothetical protein